MERDVAALERLHRPRGVPAKILLGFFQDHSRIALIPEWGDALAAEIAVLARGALDESPMQSIAGELRDRPTEQERREGGAFRIGEIGAQRPARAPRAIAMRPPCIIGKRDGLAAELQ